MTARGGYKLREPGSLKDAVTQLVQSCGGQKRASELCRVSLAQINRYTDDSEEHRFVHMPVDIVALLEAQCGDAIVTRYLALAANGLFVPLPKGGDAPYAKLLATIGREQGRLFCEACTALGDGKMSSKEAGRVTREAMRLAAALAALMGDLRNVITKASDA